MRYVKGNAVYNGRDIVVGDVRIVNPTEQQLLDAGYTAQAEATVVDEGAIRAAELRQELAEGDYKVIKCVEAMLTDEPLPYDIDALHAERDAMRAQINLLEQNNNVEKGQ